MTDELKTKIQNLLDRRVTNEFKLVYLLVELRKLMDREKYKDPILRMFANWVVHTSLELRADGSTLVLKEFDDFMIELLDNKRVMPHPYASDEHQMKRCLKASDLRG